MLDGEGVVWAWPLKHLLEVVGSILDRRLATFPLGSGHQRAPMLLLDLLVRTVRGALTGVLIPPRFTFGAIKNRSDRLLA